MPPGFFARTPSDQLNTIYRIAMIFAGALLFLPAGCFVVDASMWFVNGLAVATYGFAMGMAARSSHGFAAGVACAVLGVTHPGWVLAILPAAGALGLPHSMPFSAQPVTPVQTALEYITLFTVTGAVFGLVLAVCLLSWMPIALMTAACAIAAGFLWLQHWLLTWWPLGGLWPSAISLPAGTLHIGIATSLWFGLSRAVMRPTAAVVDVPG